MAVAVLLLTLGLGLSARGQLFVLGSFGFDAHKTGNMRGNSTQTIVSGTMTNIGTNEGEGVGIGELLGQNVPDNSLELGAAVSAGVGYKFGGWVAVGGAMGYQNFTSKLTQRQPVPGDAGINSTSTSATGSITTVVQPKMENGDWWKTSTNLFVFNPFMRFYPIATEKFTMFFEMQIPMGLGAVKATAFDATRSQKTENVDPFTGNPYVKAPFVFMVSPRLVPGVSYSFNSLISIFTTLDFLQIGYTYTMVKASISDPDGLPTVSDVTDYKSGRGEFDFGFMNKRGASVGLMFTF